MSATAVPLRPVSKSGLAALWIGLALLAALGAGFAWWQAKANQIEFTVVKAGSGPSPTDTDVVLVKYEGKLDNGTVFDANEQAPMQVSGVVPGFSQALKRMQKGGKYTIVIPPKLGYGAMAQGPIPANSRLNFTVELLDFRSEAEIRAMQQMRRCSAAAVSCCQVWDDEGELSSSPGFAVRRSFPETL
jgi:FKBP-type peptidyl-prolyl cis-trans isomerase FkpA